MKHYAIVGQSNAVGLLKYGCLDAELSTPDEPADLIDFTKGGTGIEKFLPSWDVPTLYGTFLARVNLKIPLSEKLSGIVFWQGEFDALHYETALLWPGRVMQVLNGIRTDLGVPDIPIIMVMLNSLPHSVTFEAWESMKNYQKRLIAVNLNKIDSTPYQWASDAAYPNDKVHLTPLGYAAIGKDIAALLKPVS